MLELLLLSQRDRGGELTTWAIATKHLSALDEIVYGTVDLCSCRIVSQLCASLSRSIRTLGSLVASGVCTFAPSGPNGQGDGYVSRTLKLLGESSRLLPLARMGRTGACFHSCQLRFIGGFAWMGGHQVAGALTRTRRGRRLVIPGGLTSTCTSSGTCTAEPLRIAVVLRHDVSRSWPCRRGKEKYRRERGWIGVGRVNGSRLVAANSDRTMQLRGPLSRRGEKNNIIFLAPVCR